MEFGFQLPCEQHAQLTCLTSRMMMQSVLSASTAPASVLIQSCNYGCAGHACSILMLATNRSGHICCT